MANGLPGRVDDPFPPCPDHRQRPNLLFVHYGDSEADLEGETHRIAGFLGIEHDDDALRATIEAVR